MIQKLKLSSLYFLFFISLTFNCTPNKNIANNYQESQINEEESFREKILFINYRIAKDYDESYQVSMINQIINEGKIKGYNTNIQSLKNYNLKFIQKDKQGNELEAYYLTNPLTKEVEFVDENGQFQRKVIKMDSTEFGIRLQLQQQCHKIVVELIKDSEMNTEELLETLIKKDD